MGRTTPSSTIAMSACAFATNDERTAKRVSDALGTATEMRAMKNYAGHRLSPWLGHLMVSRSGDGAAAAHAGRGDAASAIRRDRHGRRACIRSARRRRAIIEDRRFAERILPPPKDAPHAPRPDDWSALPIQRPATDLARAVDSRGRGQWRVATRAGAARSCRDREGDDAVTPGRERIRHHRRYARAGRAPAGDHPATHGRPRPPGRDGSRLTASICRRR